MKKQTICCFEKNKYYMLLWKKKNILILAWITWKGKHNSGYCMHRTNENKPGYSPENMKKSLILTLIY